MLVYVAFAMQICELNGSFQPQGMTEMNLVIQNVVWLNEYHTWKEIQG
jgi:hypothetical protein